MAAISSIANGEAMSSVRTKLNSVITEINILDPVDWTDYSATSTIVGWSSFTTKTIRYKIIGKQMFISIQLSGTSNSASTSFTLPQQNKNTYVDAPNYSVNNGISVVSYFDVAINSSTVTCLNGFSTTWTASGTKQVFGQFFIEIA